MRVMDDNVIDVTPENARPGGEAARERDDSLKSWSWVSYALHLIVALSAVVPGAQGGVTLLLIALVMDLAKKEDAQGSWHESHFVWRIRSVIWAGVLYVLTAPLFFLLFVPGYLAWAVISVWFLYRIVKGMVRMSAGRAMNL